MSIQNFIIIIKKNFEQANIFVFYFLSFENTNSFQIK